VPIFYNQKTLPGGKSNWHLNYVSEQAGPLYPFGHGLSYTSFAYDDLRITPAQVTAGGVVDVSVAVRNTGALRGMKCCSCIFATSAVVCRAR